MEFGIEKFTLLIMRKRRTIERTELSIKERISTLGEKEPYKYLEIVEADTVRQVEMEEKTIKEHLKKAIEFLEVKLSSRNLINERNTRAVHLVRYLNYS